MSGVSFNAAIVDIDGVVLAGEHPLDGAEEALHRLSEEGVQLAFLTNNVARCRDETERRLRSLLHGYPFSLIDPVDVLESEVLPREPEYGRSCLAVGTEPLLARLAAIGLNLWSPEDSDVQEQPSGVFLGSTMSFDFALMARIATLARSGVTWCTSGDEAVFNWSGRLWPGVGALAAGVQKASGTSPMLLGKPSPMMFAAAVRSFRADSRIVVVGDDLGTDICGAVECGLEAVLVLSGVTCKEQADLAPIRPHHVEPNLASFVAKVY